MIIHQFYDTGLAHASYGIISQGKMAVIDPARDPQPYYSLAAEHGAELVAVIETHPHADFVSSHLEIHRQTGAIIYVSALVGAAYPHQVFDDGDVLEMGDITLKAINTPGHSPDSICIIAEDDMGVHKIIFTGDTVFVGDVGRPDLRESAGNFTAKKEELARQMYRTTRQKIMTLPPEMVVYPAHGPGSLCGKNLSPDLQSTIGREVRDNYALQPMDEAQFIELLMHDQPYVPRYFGFDVDTNKQGAAGYEDSIKNIPLVKPNELIPGVLVIDTRIEKQYKHGHIKGSVNLQNGDKFETWLGSIVDPGEPFYLVAHDAPALDVVVRKSAKIGYEQNVKGIMVIPKEGLQRSSDLDLDYFTRYPGDYSIIDIRNAAEVRDTPVFADAINIPLPELRERIKEIPVDKPIMVHCAAGYRSAAGSSIIASATDKAAVYDLGEAVNLFVR